IGVHRSIDRFLQASLEGCAAVRNAPATLERQAARFPRASIFGKGNASMATLRAHRRPYERTSFAMSSFFTFPRIRKAWQDRGEPEGLHVTATGFWRELLVVALLVMIFALWFGFEEIDATAKAESVKNTYASPKSPFDPATLQAELDMFSTKQAE